MKALYKEGIHRVLYLVPQASFTIEDNSGLRRWGIQNGLVAGLLQVPWYDSCVWPDLRRDIYDCVRTNMANSDSTTVVANGLEKWVALAILNQFPGLLAVVLFNIETHISDLNTLQQDTISAAQEMVKGFSPYKLSKIHVISFQHGDSQLANEHVDTIQISGIRRRIFGSQWTDRQVVQQIICDALITSQTTP